MVCPFSAILFISMQKALPQEGFLWRYIFESDNEWKNHGRWSPSVYDFIIR